MSEELLFIILIVTVLVVVSPIYLQNRRIARMVDEDLKNLNYDEWKKQVGRNVYITMFSRIIWGLVILSSFLFNFSGIYSQEFRWSTVIVFALGAGFIFWGISGFRRGKKKLHSFE